MTSLILYTIGMFGVWFVADGVASLWTYLPRPDETFWRNHSFRIFRSIGGLIVTFLSGYLLYKG